MKTVERNINLPRAWVQLKHPIADSQQAMEHYEAETCEKERDLLWTQDSTNFKVSEMFYEKGNIEAVIEFGAGHYISLDIPVTKGLVIDILEAHMKKLGQLKTLMEVTHKIDKEGD